MKIPAMYLALCGLLLILPGALRHALHSNSAHAPAGANRLVIVTPNNRDIRQEFARAFSAWHLQHYGSDAALDYRSLSGSSDIVRVLQSTYDSLRNPDKTLPDEESISGKIEINLVWGGGDSYFDSELRPQGILAPVHLSPGQLTEIFPSPTLSGVKLYDQTNDASGKLLVPCWVGTCLSSFGIMYNPDVYARLGLSPPATWDDLTSDKLAGMLGLADPTHSGSVAVAYMMVIQHAMAQSESIFLHSHSKSDPGYQQALADGFDKGMATLLLMGANARYFESSATQPPMDIVNGDVAAGTVIDFYARVAAEDVGPTRGKFVVPENATAITPDPVAIMYGTTGRTRELADHFVEFLLSREGQRLWMLKAAAPGGPINRALRRAPVRRDVYADQTNWADTGNPFTQASSFNLRGAWMALFKDIRPIWAAAWIDDRDELQSAYATIRSVNDPARRNALESELAKLPITLQEVQANQNQRLQAEKAGAGDSWRAQSRMNWAATFRAHYQRVASEAVR